MTKVAVPLMLVLIAGCDMDTNQGGTIIAESKSTEANQQRLRAKYPLPQEPDQEA
jgi:hypothetical protein